jgi:Carboxypeptidase regulatory-like domain
MRAIAPTQFNLRVSRSLTNKLLLVVLAVTASWAHGQSAPTIETAVIHGIVIDASGASVPNATVGIRNGRNSNLTTTTDNSGHFTFTASPGWYALRAVSAGFSPLVRDVYLQTEVASEENIILTIDVMSTGCGVCVMPPEHLDTLNASLELLLPLKLLPPLPLHARTLKYRKG